MNNYCGFIEVWKFTDGNIAFNSKPIRIENLEDNLKLTVETPFISHTVAIFKIKLK